MILSMDLNASPLPEEDEDDAFHLQIGDDEEDEEIEQEHRETGVETLRREREERIRPMKRKQTDDVPKREMQINKNDSIVSTRNFRSYDRSKLPPGWLDCPGLGQAIGYIIPSKVPLGESFYDCIMPGKRYSSRQVIRQLGSKKIACKGRDAVPDKESVNNFVYEVLQFLSNQKHSPRYVLVHCTHGHNRTGFMIIHYLIRSHHVSVTKALQIFAYARPPGIYKEEYIDALYKFYHEKRPEIVTCPPTPEWKRSCDLDLNGNAEDDEDKDGLVAGTSPGHHSDRTHDLTLLDGEMVIDTMPTTQMQERRYLIYDLMAINSQSIVEMPRGVPVATVAIENAANAALLAVKILAIWDADLRERVVEYHDDIEASVLRKADKLENGGWEAYPDRNFANQVRFSQANYNELLSWIRRLINVGAHLILPALVHM